MSSNSDEVTDTRLPFAFELLDDQQYCRVTGDPDGSISGDPQFVGLQGQNFQVHGLSFEHFNLISTPNFCLNARFIYLNSGKCDYSNTACWTHPGTYLDQLGFLLPGKQIKVFAGSHSEGLKVWVNQIKLEPNQIGGSISFNNNTDTDSIYLPRHDKLFVQTPLFHIEVTNSDYFFNIRFTLLDQNLLRLGAQELILDDDSSLDKLSLLYPNVAIDGLLGQTWRNVRYASGAPFRGEIEDYMILSHGLLDPNFLFSVYEGKPPTRR
jgi:hypothetical protein